MNVDITGIIVSGFVLLLMLILSAVLMSGHGAFLISGYNMLPKEKQAEYDAKALCRFVGSLLLVIAFLLVFAIIAGIYGIDWLAKLITAIIITFTIGCVIYANTNHRFKKK
jgi:hypothetical protein